MALENNQFDGHRDIAQFLEKFREQNNVASNLGAEDVSDANKKPAACLISPARTNQSFEKLEEKILELEERFEASAAQNHLILSELARTREVMEHQQSKNDFVDSLAQTIESLKSSVQTLSKAQLSHPFSYNEPEVQRSFDREPEASFQQEEPTAIYHYQPAHYRHAQEEKASQERAEKERVISSLHQKASQLKAVNIALDREIKKVQQEKMDALKKSAEQAKEILSLREQLTAAEERFKSFDFEGRIISIKQQYQQKVNHLENQLREISNTCMRQVEEIESLKAENVKLHQVSQEKTELLARLEAKNQEVLQLQTALEAARKEHGSQAKKQVETFALRLRALEEERGGLSARLAEVQSALQSILDEKQTLERNFKELLIKINSNDAVINGLKQKIDVLTAQNTQLHQERNTLAQQNKALGEEAQRLVQDRALLVKNTQTLSAEKANLAQRNAMLTQEQNALKSEADAWKSKAQSTEQDKSRLAGEKETLGRRANALSEEKKQLEKELLLKKKEELLSVQGPIAHPNALRTQDNRALAHPPENLSVSQEAAAREAEILNQQNRELRTQSAALLAARLATKKREAAKQAELARHPEAEREDQPAPHKENLVPLSETPVEMQKTMRSKVQTEADLPEIKVAEPIPQPEEPFGGEDFLEKTDSFIGRMKWSIFREDK